MKPGDDGSDWNLDKTSSKRSILGHYRGTYLAYDILYEPCSSETEEKAEDKLAGNRIVNLIF